MVKDMAEPSRRAPRAANAQALWGLTKEARVDPSV